jgi:hypothetical protein
VVISENRTRKTTENSVVVTDMRLYDLVDGILVARKRDSWDIHTQDGFSAW